MKRLLFLLMAAMLVLAACGSDESNEELKSEDKPQEETKQEEVKQEEKGIYFDGETAQIEMVKIDIKETKVIPVGEEGNKYGDKPVFAIWYDATNLSDEDIDANMAWIAIFDAIQDNDENMVNKLEMASLPDEAHLNTQSNTIKKDGTVENSVAYELDDEITPVTLVATQGVMGDEIGRHDYEIK